MAGIVNAHGGGACMMRAQSEVGYMSRIAASLDVVVFNIEYRLGPETKCPGGQKDAAEAVKYFHEHAEEHGLDNTKLALNGLSGGAWIVAGAAILLGREDKHDLVKSHLWMFPQLGFEMSRLRPSELEKWERAWAPDANFFLTLLATDL